MEGDCVFETAAQRVRQVKKTVKEKHAGSSDTDMSWKRMRERSSARELSAMSTAESILAIELDVSESSWEAKESGLISLDCAR